MPQNAADFIKAYAQAYDAYDVEQVAAFYHIPAIIMRDEKKSVLVQRQEVIDELQELVQRLQQIGVVYHQPEVVQSMRLSDNILFAHVRWSYLDQQQQKLLGCHVSYTLQRTESGELTIIASVIDDEEKAIARLLNEKGE